MDRFHQDFRDTLMTSAVERKYDANAGECMKYILQQMYVCTQPWMTYSNPISLVDIRHMAEARSANTELIKFLDQYVNILRECDWVDRWMLSGWLTIVLSCHFSR